MSWRLTKEKSTTTLLPDVVRIKSQLGCVIFGSGDVVVAHLKREKEKLNPKPLLKYFFCSFNSFEELGWPQNTQSNDIQHNDTKHSTI